MSALFKNAVDSVQLGIEDYQANDPKRALSAVRNFYWNSFVSGRSEAIAKRVVPATPGPITTDADFGIRLAAP